jgi:NH3-dependent NAD+ synthetase
MPNVDVDARYFGVEAHIIKTEPAPGLEKHPNPGYTDERIFKPGYKSATAMNQTRGY